MKAEKKITRDEETCSACRYFRDGKCYRMPPVWTVDPQDALEGDRQLYSQFNRPDVLPDDFCGEWTPQSQK